MQNTQPTWRMYEDPVSLCCLYWRVFLRVRRLRFEQV